MKKKSGYQRREAEHFDELAVSHEDWWGAQTKAGRERFRRRAEILKVALSGFHSPKVLELGCGTGAFTQYVLDEMPDLALTGCDISPKSLEIAARRCDRFPNAKFEVMDVTDESAKIGPYDAVVGNAILHHLDLDTALEFCMRALKPDGLLWFAEPNMLNPQIAIEKNVRFVGKLSQSTEDETAFLRWKIAKELHSRGFRRVRVIPFDFLHPLVPDILISPVKFVSLLVENIPVLREVSGSLIIAARK